MKDVGNLERKDKKALKLPTNRNKTDMGEGTVKKLKKSAAVFYGRLGGI